MRLILYAQVLPERSFEVFRERQGRAEKPPVAAIIDFLREGLLATNRLKRRRPEYLPPLVPDCGWDRGDPKTSGKGLEKFAKPLLSILVIGLLTACASFGDNGAAGSRPETAATKQTKRFPLFTGDGGKGIVIAVPAPIMQNSTQANNWIPQFFQDIITGDLARYSAMTVLDRGNEKLALAEQELAASGYYSDEDYAALGKITNARYIVAGSIRNISGRYTVSFRINDAETNEIQASFNNQYSAEDVERGLAAKEVVRELLAGMGVELTAEGEQQLLSVPEVEVRATAQLAKGMAAEEKNGNIVEALAFYTQAIDTGANMNEAAQHIQNFAQHSPGASIRERANYALEQKAKWEKIFKDLEAYTRDNLAIVIYDFSTISDTFNVRNNTVDITITPGIKIIPDRTVLAVWKTVMENWNRIINTDELELWARSVSYSTNFRGSGGVHKDVRDGLLYFGDIEYQYTVQIGLYDDYGDRIAGYESRNRLHYEYGYTSKGSLVVAQHKYYDEAQFESIPFNRIQLNMITDNLTPRIESVKGGLAARILSSIQPLVMSVVEWEQWLAR
jgi:TolB-like protein